VSSLEQSSNAVGKLDQTIFLSDLVIEKSLELKRIRQELEKQGNWRFVADMMRMELKHTLPGLPLKAAVEDALKLCEILNGLKQPPLVFRSVLLKKRVAAALPSVQEQFSLSLTQEYLSKLKGLKPASFEKWEDFCPAIAHSLGLASSSSKTEKVEQLLQLIDESNQRKDYTSSNTTYFAAIDIARRNAEETKGSSEAAKSLNVLRDIQQSFIAFHRDTTKMLFFQAAGLAYYLTTLRIRDRTYLSVLNHVEEFEKLHPEFGVPSSQERLYDHALYSATQLGLEDKIKTLKDKYDEWMPKCSFMKTTSNNLTEKALFDPGFFLREIEAPGGNDVDRGDNSLRLMVLWAGHEWNRNLMSIEDCKRLFGPGLDHIPPSKLTARLGKDDLNILSASIFGTKDEPSATVLFLNRYGKLLEWILTPERLPSQSSRIFALKVFLKSRLYRLRESLIIQGFPTAEQNSALEMESRELIQLEKIESAANGNDSTQKYEESSLSVNNLLVKCYVENAVDLGLINEEALLSQIAKCRELITQYSNDGDLSKQYHALCQLIQLHWQRYVKFRTTPAEAIMPFVREADEVFVKTRRLISSLAPPEDLVARVKFSQEFSHRQHQAFALAGRYTAFETYMAQMSQGPIEQLQRLAIENYNAFMHWTLRAKGKGFVDVLEFESDVSQTIERAQVDINPETGISGQLEATNISITNALTSNNDNMVTKFQIEKMLQSLPDGIVLVDFIDVTYSNTPTNLIAMIHRRGQLMNFPVKIPSVDMAKVEKWVENYLDDGTKQPKLNKSDSFEKLAELSGLLMSIINHPAGIKPGETVLLCPTGSLNRVPIHAIPLEGQPFIERNAVVYCQSLTVLHWLWLRSQSVQQQSRAPKAVVINPLPEDWVSTERVAEIANTLAGDLHHGFKLKASTISKAVEGVSIFHYHGHVHFNARSALDSTLILNQKAYIAADKGYKPPGCEFFTARDFFKVKFQQPALASIIGCGSGMASISSTDDVLGIPTALFYAGASSVVSTLWPIDDEDGAEFGKEFYAALREQITRTQSPEAHDVIANAMDIAKAMQTAVMKLRERESLLTPYHWAAFTLNGFWMLPLDIFSISMATSSTTAKSTRREMTSFGMDKLPYDLEDPKDMGKTDFLHDAGHSMTQVWNTLSNIGSGPHTMNIDVEWQLLEFVRDGLDKTQDLATVLTITGEPDKAYVCSCEDYVKFAWGENTTIAQFFGAFAALELNSLDKARKYTFPSSLDIDCS
jgi:CHAT domain-containing protein